jgi:peptidoglycan/LPS O-acetylase OafA/YrhL
MIQNYTTGQISSNGSLWSLPIEMELYLLFPVILMIMRKYNFKVVLFISAVVSFIALFLHLNGINYLGLNFAVNLLLWCAGAVLAELYASDRLKNTTKVINLSGFVFLFLAIFGKIKNIDPVILNFLYGVFFVVVLWNFLIYENAIFPRLSMKLNKFFVFLGNISYSLYLIHYPYFVLCGALWVKYFGEKPINFFVPLLFSFSTLPLAWFFYKLIEMPSHKLAKRVAILFIR